MSGTRFPPSLAASNAATLRLWRARGGRRCLLRGGAADDPERM